MRYLKDIDITKSSGLDKISSNCLKAACMALSTQLAHIFDMSIENSIFPECWKIGTIVPLFILKGGKRMKFQSIGQFLHCLFRVKL